MQPGISGKLWSLLHRTKRVSVSLHAFSSSLKFVFTLTLFQELHPDYQGSWDTHDFSERCEQLTAITKASTYLKGLNCMTPICRPGLMRRTTLGSFQRCPRTTAGEGFAAPSQEPHRPTPSALRILLSQPHFIRHPSLVFTRATLCVMCISASLLSPGVRLSVTFVHSIQTAEDIVKLLVRPGSSSFWPMRRYQFQGEPLQQGREIQGVGKFAIFNGNCRLSRKGYEMGLLFCYGTLIGSHMRSIAWWHFQWSWRTPNPVFNLKVT